VKVTMKKLYSTPEFTAKPGDVIDVPAAIGKQLIADRAAVAAGKDPAEQLAKAAQTGKAAARGARGRGRGKAVAIAPAEDDPEDEDEDGDADGEADGDGDAGAADGSGDEGDGE
jgi:hypothetical protein